MFIDSSKATSRYTFIFTIVLVLIYSVWGLCIPGTQLAALFFDDSFFYIKIAYNISAGFGSTFDTIHPTNGYHPLYLFLLTGLSSVFPLQGLPGIKAVFLLDNLLFLIGCIFINRIASIFKAGFWIRCLLITIAFFAIGTKDAGMETRLLFPVLSFIIYQLFRFSNFDHQVSALRWIGIGFFLLVLTRIDYVLLIMVIAICIAGVDILKKKKFRPALFWLGLPGIALGILFMWNHVHFGHISSVSSSLKASSQLFPEIYYPTLIGSSRMKIYFIFLLSIINILFAVVVRPKGSLWIVALCFGNILYFSVILVFMRGGLHHWYLNIPLLICYLSLVYLGMQVKFVQHLYNRYKKTSSVFLAGVVFLLVAASFYSIIYKTTTKRYFDDAIAMSFWLQKNIDPNEPVFQVDESGITGYFSQRKIINGDGLVNSWDYQDYLNTHNLDGYFSEEKIQYVLYDGYHGQKEVSIEVPLWKKKSCFIKLINAVPLQTMGKYAIFKIDEANTQFIYP